MKTVLGLFTFVLLISLSAQAQDISNPVQYFYEQLQAEEQRKADSIRKAQEDSKAMLRQMLLQHPKGCGCATRLHRALNNMVNNSGELKADTTKYFFQFGRVFKQIGGHEIPKKEGKQ
jgi:hypothetical protein